MKKQSKPTQEVLEQIKKKELQVKPRWHFTLKRILRWSLIALLSIFAALNFSIAYFFFTSESMPMFKELDIGTWKYLLLIMPTIWLIIFAVLIVVAYKQFHATKHGYRYQFWAVIAVLFFLTLIPGIGLSRAGFAFKTYDFAREHIPGYESIDMHGLFWDRPDSGFLTGRIATLEDQTRFELRYHGESWQINASNAELIETDKLLEGDHVRLHGELQGDDHFIADAILLLNPRFAR